ncbi:MAG TPA: 4-hydroxythreonine-4-phosphate dehydrogenase PdxA [Kiritimatiellae bacterium]|nr:4-hydroxythreonine-4-phosphate dehydrogenase PdxA [Kiritimatiellia bacterium]
MKIVALTCGDPCGIGPEVALKAALKHRWPADVRLVLMGNRHLLEATAQLCSLPLPADWTPKQGRPRGKVTLWDPGPRTLRAMPTPGRVSPIAARMAAEWIRHAARECLRGTFQAMVTAPISKEAMAAAGLNIPGHTEYLARLTRRKSAVMLLMGGRLKVVPLTRHISLRSVPDALSRAAILHTIRILVESRPLLGLRRIRIGVAALNPHAGEGGRMGDEERKIISPAVQEARKMGWQVEGPVPADVIFHRAIHGCYDVVISMYHDQGLAPLKMLAFDTGVNVTLGLPLIRTSPDHGTAFDIAGLGIARDASMRAAIRTAIDMAGRRNPWG